MIDLTQQVGGAVLHIEGLSKRFGEQEALSNVNLSVHRGEIHGLLGENGAGKSTLIKVLAGVYTKDTGTIVVGGEPNDGASSAMAFVHQDLGLVEGLTVLDNVALQTGFSHRGPFISYERTAKRVEGLLEELGIDVDPRWLVAELSQDQKVMVAVARALAQRAEIVVLDEVSASLPAPEMARLQESLRVTRDRGVSYLFVTHRLEEVFELADRVTVLRDGRVRATADIAATTHDEVVDWIVGRAVETKRAEIPETNGRVALDVRGLVGTGVTVPLSITIAPGEVLGVCGLIGSGTRELAAMLGGDATPEQGTATLYDHRLRLGHPRHLRRAGCLFVPGDRQRDGVAADLSIRENLFLARGSIGAVADPFVILPRSERGMAGDVADTITVRPRGSVDRGVCTLSGGNQQKIVLGRALRAHPQLLVLEDPTAGVDIGSRVELHRLIQEAAADGTAVLLVSTDYEEVASQAHRALVLHSGRVVAELHGEALTADRLAAESYGPQPQRQHEPHDDEGDDHESNH